MPLDEEDKQWFKSELTVLRTELTVLRTELRAELQAVESRLDAKIERVETALLTEFHKWASPFETRMRGIRAMQMAQDAELEFLSDRLKKLEPPRTT